MLITIEMLRKKNAYEEDKALFVELFGESVEYSVELHQQLFQQHPEFERWLIQEAIIQPLCLQVGNGQQVQVGYHGTAVAGYRGTAIAGHEGTATAGHEGTATAGDFGTATVGYRGTATAGIFSIAKAGLKGEVHLRYWDDAFECYRTTVGFIDGIILKADVFYKLNENHEFVEA